MTPQENLTKIQSLYSNGIILTCKDINDCNEKITIILDTITRNLY